MIALSSHAARVLAGSLLCLSLVACGGGGGDTTPSASVAQAASADQSTSATSASAPVATPAVAAPTLSAEELRQQALLTTLYGHNTATVTYAPVWGYVPADSTYLWDWIAYMPMLLDGPDVSLYQIKYAYNDLPQNVVKLSKPGNTKLLVYNQGHGPATWWPDWAANFLREALNSGYDVLIPSLPLFGLNTPLEDRTYHIKTRGVDAWAAVSPDILWDKQHSLYEYIDDPDHYLHYFVDGALLTTRSSDIRSADGSLTFMRKADGMDGYTEVDYVGLSGGGTAGLVACATQHFDHCVLVAGFLPDYLRVQSAQDFGDIEQFSRSFYSLFSSQELMAMARRQSGTLTLIYNRYDSCCFADPGASQFKADFPDYDIRITELDYHGFLPEDILSALQAPVTAP